MDVLRSIHCGTYALEIPSIAYTEGVRLRRIELVPRSDPNSFDGAARIGRRYSLKRRGMSAAA